MSAQNNHNLSNLNLDQFGVLPTSQIPGLHYHDLSEPDARAYDNSEGDENTSIRQPVDISSLHTVQYSVNRDKVRQKLEDPADAHRVINVLKVNGQNWIEDGHHHVTAAVIRGEKRVQAVVALGRPAQ